MVGVRRGQRLRQNSEPIDRDALGDRVVPRRSHGATTVVVAVSRNVDDATLGFVGRPIELRHREGDPGANRRAVRERAWRLHDAMPN